MTEQQPDYWAMTNKELVEICKKHSISRWSGKRKKDLVAMIKQHIADKAPQSSPLPPFPPSPPFQPIKDKDPEPYEMLDALLLEHANRALASLPKSPINEFVDFVYL
jgi:hypothetical protein